MLIRKKKRKKKIKRRSKRTFSLDEVRQFYLYTFTIINDKEKALVILQACFERWKIIPREFLKKPEIYFYQLLRKRSYLEIGHNHKGSEVNTTNVLDFSIESLEELSVKSLDSFYEHFWQMKPLSRELIYFWAMEKRTLDEISLLIGRKRVELLVQMVDIKNRFKSNED